jgi:hypothetical protein
MYLRCQARWHWSYVMGFKPEQTEAMRRGSRLHAAWERYLLTGQLAGAGEVLIDGSDDHITENEVEIFLSTLHRLPSPPVASHLVERRFVDTESYAPVDFRGTIDLISPSTYQLADGRLALLVVDHKTTSALRWAKIGPELLNDFQALAYVAEAQRVTQWAGPIVFRLVYAVTRRPFISETRQAVFELDQIEAGRAFVRETLRGMLATSATQDPACVPFNVEACGDYKSKANPDGCPHRRRCAALGRPVAAGFDVLLFQPPNLGASPMSDPFADLLNQASQPATADPFAALEQAAQPAQPAVDPAHTANLVRFAVLRPGTSVGAADLAKAVEVAEAEQTRLIVEITTLRPELANDEARKMLRTRSIHRLEELREQSSRPRDPASMSREDLEAELALLAPETVGRCADKTTEQCVQLLNILRARASTADHAVNSPEAISPTGPPDTTAAAKASEPKPAATGKSSTRGARMPERFGGGLVSGVTKKSGHMQAYLQEAGIAVPTGAGSTKRMRQLVLDHLSGGAVPAPANSAPVTPSPTPPINQEQERKRLECIAEIERLAEELEVAPLSMMEAWPIPKVVDTLKRLRLMKAEREALAKPAPAKPETPKAAQFNTFTLYVDCHPEAAQAVDILLSITGIGQAVAKAAGVGHYLAIGYNDGAKKVAAYLASQVAAGEVVLPPHVFVSSTTPSGGPIVEALAPLAAEVVRGVR